MNGVWWQWCKRWWKSNSTFALLRGYIPFLLFEAFWGEWDALYFSFSFLLGGYLVPLILLSDTCPFLPLVLLFLFFEVPGTCPFLFPRFFSFFQSTHPSRNNIASGSNQDNLSIYFTGTNKDRRMFLATLSRIGVE